MLQLAIMPVECAQFHTVAVLESKESSVATGQSPHLPYMETLIAMPTSGYLWLYM